MQSKPKPSTCDWCSKDRPHRLFGGWWIWRACDDDFFSRNGRAQWVHQWLAARGKVPQWVGNGSIWKLTTKYLTKP